MAILTGAFKFEGSLDGFSAYKMRGSDKTIIRKKGGASKKTIKTSPKFINTRNNNTEWGACSSAGKSIRETLYSLRHLADYNISGPLLSLIKFIQKQDSINAWGKRSILFSQNRKLLEGFSYNQKIGFDSVLRSGYKFIINKDTATATIEFPDIWPNIHLYNPNKYTYFRIVLSFGYISDFAFDETHQEYKIVGIERTNKRSNRMTDWFSTSNKTESMTLKIGFQDAIPIEEHESLILGVGIEFGFPLSNAVTEPIKYSGCAKILSVE